MIDDAIFHVKKLADTHYWLDDEIREYLRMVANEAQNRQWINVAHQMPAAGETVLAMTDTNNIFTCRAPVIESNLKQPEPKYGRLSRFTHWMPLPKSLESQEEDLADNK